MAEHTPTQKAAEEIWAMFRTASGKRDLGFPMLDNKIVGWTDFIEHHINAANKALVEALTETLPFLEIYARTVDFEVGPLTKARAVLAQATGAPEAGDD